MTPDKNVPIVESSWNEDANGKKWEDYETILCPDGTVIDMVALIDDQYRAMAALNHLAPMFGGFISKLRFIPTFRVQTQATDGFNVFYNPQFTASLDFTGKVFVMAHELMHCLLNHLRRAKAAGHTNPQKSNIAADYEVNDTLVDIGLFKSSTITKIGGYYDDKYVKWGFEKIYDAISSPSSMESQDNSKESSQAAKNQDQKDSRSGSQSQSRSGSGNGNDNQRDYSADYKAGWAQAIQDYQEGKLKL